MIGNEVIITGIVGLVTSIASAWTSWFFARKKYNSEVDSNVINNMQESLDFYKALSDDNRVRLELMQEDNMELRKQIADLQTRVLEMMTQICLNMSCIHRIPLNSTKDVVDTSEDCEKG